MLESTDYLRHRSGMMGDPLTDILTLASAKCAVSSRLAAGGSWALRFPPPQEIKFTAVVKGACWLTVEGEVAPLRLETGDVVMVSADRSFVLAGDLNAPQADGAQLFADALDDMAVVGDGNDFFAIGGHVVLDAERGHVLADVLPPVLHVDGKSSEASAMRWLLDQLVKEVAADRPGAVLASEQLAQLLFVQTIRSYLAASGPLAMGWIGALRDERIAPALRLMHREPGRAWQLGELAKQVGMSRTSFAVRFKATAGVAPLTYLLNWRMRLAGHGLRVGSLSISELALSVGYTSESAFSNAFKRTTGMAPRRYRSRFAMRDQSTSRRDQAPGHISIVA
jgi:AraC-like DNA-binding protein